MKYIKQGLITAEVWRTEDESKHNVLLLKLAERINLAIISRQIFTLH